MADTGYNWGSVAHVTYDTGTPVDGIAIADAGNLTSDVQSMDGLAAYELSIVTYEDNTGACDDEIDIYILGTDNDPDSLGWQVPTDPGVLKFQIDQVQNTTHVLVLAIDPKQYSQFKIYVDQQSGQEIALTINKNEAKIPVAS